MLPLKMLQNLHLQVVDILIYKGREELEVSELHKCFAYAADTWSIAQLTLKQSQSRASVRKCRWLPYNTSSGITW